MQETVVNMDAALKGMIYEKNARVDTRDGSHVMVNVFRPEGDGQCPALLAVSPYGKDLHTKDGFAEIWVEMREHMPKLGEKSTLSLHTWESNAQRVLELVAAIRDARAGAARQTR